MSGSKPWWQSKTIWASLIGAIFAAASFFKVLPEGLDQEQVLAAVTTITGVLAAVFRVGATAEVSAKK